MKDEINKVLDEQLKLMAEFKKRWNIPEGVDTGWHEPSNKIIFGSCPDEDKPIKPSV